MFNLKLKVMNEVIYGLPVGQAKTGIIPAGYYSSEIRGSHEKFINTWYHGTEDPNIRHCIWRNQTVIREDMIID